MLQDWFTEARLEIFLHWGIYSTGEWSESWDWFNGAVDRASYMAQTATFDAGRFDPDAWAEQFERVGAEYAVLTNQHDGFALWDTRLSDWNAKDASAAKLDLVGPYCEALRKRGIKVGLYFSHLDWSHPDCSTVLPSKPPHPSHAGNRLAYPEPGHEDPAAWEQDGAQWRFEELQEQLPQDQLPQDQLQQWATGVVLDRPIDGVAVKGIRNKVLSKRIIGGQPTSHRVVGGAPWANLPGELWIDVPPDALDADATVIAVTLEGPLDLYTGSGHAQSVDGIFH